MLSFLGLLMTGLAAIMIILWLVLSILIFG